MFASLFKIDRDYGDNGQSIATDNSVISNIDIKCVDNFQSKEI